MKRQSQSANLHVYDGSVSCWFRLSVERGQQRHGKIQAYEQWLQAQATVRTETLALISILQHCIALRVLRLICIALGLSERLSRQEQGISQHSTAFNGSSIREQLMELSCGRISRKSNYFFPCRAGNILHIVRSRRDRSSI